MAPRIRKLTEPLETMTFVFGMFLAMMVGFGITGALLNHSMSFAGLGNPTICATDTNITIGGGSPGPGDPPLATKPGAWLNNSTHLQACTSHHGIGLRLLYSLTELPNLVLFAAVLVLLWRIIRLARREGPFSPRIASLMRWLGWLIIAGSLVASAIQQLAAHVLLDTMLVHGVDWVFDLIIWPFTSLLPWRIIVAGALLTFARVMRHGAAMEDEIRATI